MGAPGRARTRWPSARRTSRPRASPSSGFNAYPGYHFRDLHRRLMLYHLAGCDTTDPSCASRRGARRTRFRGARGRRNSLRVRASRRRRRSTPSRSSEKGAAGLAWFHHDLLATINTPVYFHEFADTVSRHGLQFAGDATLRVPRMMEHKPGNPPGVAGFGGRHHPPGTVPRFHHGRPLPAGAPLPRRCSARPLRSDWRACAACTWRATSVRRWPPPPPPPWLPPPTPGCPDDAFAGRAGRIVVKRSRRTGGPGADRRGVARRGVLRRVGGAAGRDRFAGGTRRISVASGGEQTGVFDHARERVGACAQRTPRGQRGRPSPGPDELARHRPASPMDTLDPFERHLLGLLDGSRDRAALLAAMRVWIKSGQAANDHRRRRRRPYLPGRKKAGAFPENRRPGSPPGRRPAGHARLSPAGALTRFCVCL